MNRGVIEAIMKTLEEAPEAEREAIIRGMCKPRTVTRTAPQAVTPLPAPPSSDRITTDVEWV